MTTLAGHICWGQPGLVPQAPRRPELQQQLYHLYGAFARSQEQRRLLLRGGTRKPGDGKGQGVPAHRESVPSRQTLGPAPFEGLSTPHPHPLLDSPAFGLCSGGAAIWLTLLS